MDAAIAGSVAVVMSGGEPCCQESAPWGIGLVDAGCEFADAGGPFGVVAWLFSAVSARFCASLGLDGLKFISGISSSGTASRNFLGRFVHKSDCRKKQ